jgi:repressor LexA
MTDAQRRVLDYVLAFMADKGYAPTVRQIGADLGYTSSATSQAHLKALVEQGYLRGTGRTLRPGDRAVTD